MDDEIYVIGHRNPDTDSICSAIAYADLKNRLGFKNVKPGRLGDINPETEFVLKKFNTEIPEIISDGTGMNLILVDHNEFSQSVKNIEKARIIEVIEHHKINFNYPEPIFFLSRPVGATATIIADMFFEKNVEIPDKIAGILLASILSDTVIFKSKTTTDEDIEVANKLADIVGISDIEKFGIEVKKAKSSIENLNAREIILSDFKDFEFKKGRVGIGQVEIVDAREVEERRKELLRELDNLRIDGGYDLIILMVTDIMREGSELLVSGNKDIVERAFDRRVVENSIYLEGVMSRKKEVVPRLQRILI